MRASYLRDVKGAPITLAVAEDNEDASFLNSSAYALHLGRVTLHGVAMVFVHELAIVNGVLCPDAPFPS